MMSLMPTGMPSIAESGLPTRQRCVAVSADLRAASVWVVTKAPSAGSCSDSAARQRSRWARGLSLPAVNCLLAARNGRGANVFAVASATDMAGTPGGDRAIVHARRKAVNVVGVAALDSVRREWRISAPVGSKEHGFMAHLRVDASPETVHWGF